MKRRFGTAVFLALAACLMLAALAWASAEVYLLPAWVAAGGGSTVSNAGYALSGTAGQGEANTALTAGPYSLEPGFWHTSGYSVFLPMTEK